MRCDAVMQMRLGPRRPTLAGLSLLLALSGCGGETVKTPSVGEVSGMVTLDGNPLEGAIVIFEPDTTRSSNGRTDAQGKYELMFNKEVKGAALGKHKVRISRRDDPLKGAREALPAKYNQKTELTADVKTGKNENVNFDLKSK